MLSSIKGLLLLCCTSLAATTGFIQTNQVETLPSLVDQKTWLVVDLDNTLFQADRALGHVDWLQTELKKRIDAGASRENAFHSLYPMWKKMQSEINPIAVDQHLLDTIEEFQQQGVTVMGLTHRQLFIAPETVDQLHQLGVDLITTAPSKETFEIASNQPALYRDGVLFVDDFNTKGEVFLSFLDRTQTHPEKIVFIDDKEKNVIELGKALASRGIAYTGIHYTAVEEGERIYSSESARAQLKARQHRVDREGAPSRLYKLMSLEEWEESLKSGAIKHSKIDSPFIHLATKEQVKHVTEKFWAGKDHIVLELDPTLVSGDLRFENNPGGSTRYYHLYQGMIPMESITSAEIKRVDHTVVRGAIDFGSGTVKLQVAKVDPKQNQVIGTPLIATHTPNNLTEDVAAHDNYISEEMYARALQILSDYKARATALAGERPIDFFATATAVFRKAYNGPEVLARLEKALDIKFQMLPQEEEGRLGFLTAKVFHPNVADHNLIAWDSGNGSFQCASKEIDGTELVYQGEIGHGTVRLMLAQEVRERTPLKANESGNSLSMSEAAALRETLLNAFPPVPNWLKEKLANRDTTVATFGDGESIFALSAEAIASLKRSAVSDTILRDDVQRVIDHYVGQPDATFDRDNLHRKTLTSAIHLATAMDHLGVTQVHFSRSVGNTPGMLINPGLWK